VVLPIRATTAAPLPAMAVLPPEGTIGEWDAAGAARSSQQTPQPPPPADRFYTVRKGDRLFRIARRFQVSLRALTQANQITEHSIIRPGQRLRIPSGSSKAEARQESLQSPSELVETALSYRGVPYRYAGMSSRGMDCSGLVARVLRLHGVMAPHNSRQLFKLGTPVSRAELRPGDLVFFRTRGRSISHVGIYIANGQFVHASSGGGRVQIDSLDSGYYAQRLVGARRLP